MHCWLTGITTKNFRNFRLGQISHVILQSHYIWGDRGIGGGLLENRISWFSYDVTKIQSKKLSILLRFYVVLQHLKPLSNKIFGSKVFFVLRYRKLKFPGFCVTRHLADGQSSCVG